MLDEPLAFAKNFVDELNRALQTHCNHVCLTGIQTTWISFCITAIVLTNQVCWASFERLSLGRVSLASLSWMFRRSKIVWESLLVASVFLILHRYGIREGLLIIDDTDNPRSKNTKEIAHAHKIKDKKTGGYCNGQCIVYLLLVTSKVTIPVGFKFYQPDPKVSAWRKENNRLKRQGIAKRNRPAEPLRDPKHPTKAELAILLVEAFSKTFPLVSISCVLADGLYGHALFIEGASRIYPLAQVLSQIRSNQQVREGEKYISVTEYFKNVTSSKQLLQIRGQSEKAVEMIGRVLHVKSHGCKRLVVALKYAGENEYRYLLAKDVSWQVTDIARVYTLRWLVEVFIQDWKSYEGWCQLAKQPGVEGSCRGVILSLLVDHSLLLCPEQKALIDGKLPACTVGSLRAKISLDALIAFVRKLLTSPCPEQKLKEILERFNRVVQLNPSKKHMNGTAAELLWPSLAQAPLAV